MDILLAKKTLQKDAILHDIIQWVDAHGGIHIPVKKKITIYDVLIRSIISQQLSLKAAQTIYLRFLNLFNNQTPTPEKLIQTTIESLRSVGISNQKAGYLKSVAEFALNHNLKASYIQTLTNDDLLIYLTSIKGVGKWTAEMVMLFELQRTDVFPIDDLIIRTRICEWYSIQGNARQINESCKVIAEKWNPFQSIACLYIWKWNDLHRKKST